MSENKNNSGRDWIIGLILVVLGVVFLAGEIFDFSFGDVFWPFFIIIPGVLLFVLMSLGGKNANFLAIPASMITAVGLILFVQNTFDIFETWSYVWALVFPTSFGLGLYLHGSRTGSRSTMETGKGFMRTGLILLAIFFAFFELVIGISNFAVSEYGIPVLLILLGVYLLMRRGRRKPAAEVAEKPPPEVEADEREVEEDEPDEDEEIF